MSFLVRFAALTCCLLFGDLSTALQPDPSTSANQVSEPGSPGATVRADAAGKEREAEPSCVLAIPDLHGDMDKAHTALGLLGIDPDQPWGRPGCLLVQTGDLVDRGPHSKGLTNLFEQLKVTATASGGEVVTLLGNHELMQLQGEFSYLNPKELARLAEQQEGTQTTGTPLPVYYKQRVEQVAAKWARSGQPRLSGVGLAEWARRLHSGDLGTTLRSKRALAVRGTGRCRTVFVHAGIIPEALRSLERSTKVSNMRHHGEEAINLALESTLRRCTGETACDEGANIPLLGSNGFFWSRKLAQAPEKVMCEQLEAVLEKFGAHQMVVGHTIQERARTRCSKQLYLMDTGMAMGGQAVAWSCVDGEVEIKTA